MWRSIPVFGSCLEILRKMDGTGTFGQTRGKRIKKRRRRPLGRSGCKSITKTGGNGRNKAVWGVK
ncbi:hypothetical protein HMPREF3033_01250 [Veillonellaceae bacterium DNF00751]|nr:hypothetical protein HMPREF3033_01250 [Veillonellaceae bacterium DNF00751]